MSHHFINEYDLFYISYDEPQKEEFWAKLQEIAPWAKRIDNVKGFDTVHKECAKNSETNKFITVDGDNIVYPEFFELDLNIPDNLEDHVLSWASKNIINGLDYGNGGVKLWTKDFVLNMKTHENAVSDDKKVDFCWNNKYLQLNNTYSDTCPNGSPFQAFRAGFREGVKMTLNRGDKASGNTVARSVHEKNYRRLLIWASIGADVENGLWAIYGARLGIFKSNIDKKFDISKISDYDWFKLYFYDEVAPTFIGNKSEKCKRTGYSWDKNLLLEASNALLEPLKKDLGMNIANINEEQSTFFKSTYEPSIRNANPLMKE